MGSTQKLHYMVSALSSVYLSAYLPVCLSAYQSVSVALIDQQPDGRDRGLVKEYGTSDVQCSATYPSTVW